MTQHSEHTLGHGGAIFRARIAARAEKFANETVGGKRALRQAGKNIDAGLKPRCGCHIVMRLLPAGVVGAFARYHNIMHMAFAHTGPGDAHELGAGMKIGNRLAAGIAHRGAQTANDLMQHG